MFFSVLLTSALAGSAYATAIPATVQLEARAPYACPQGNPNPSYIVPSGDVQPVALSLQLGVSTLNFLAVNRLQKDSKLTPGQKLCVPPTCRLWKVQDGNTCDSIPVAFGISKNAFFDHNPGIDNPSCSNLDPGTNVCLDKSYGSNFPRPY